MKLTPKQQMFVAEYLVDLNATQAAIRAGYPKKTASVIGYESLTKPHIAEAVQSSMTKRSAKTDITAQKVLREIAYMAFYDVGELASAKIGKPEDIASLPEHIRKAIVGWSWDKFGNFVLKLSPKTPSQELLGRHLKLFTDKIEFPDKHGDPQRIGSNNLILMTMQELEEELRRYERITESTQG